MDTLLFNSGARTLSANYVGTDLKIKSETYTLESNGVIYKSSIFNNASDVKINNYSAIYLTDKRSTRDFFEFDAVEEKKLQDLVTPIFINTCNNGEQLYLYIEETTTDENKQSFPYLLLPESKIYNSSRKYFEIQIIDNAHCRVAHNIEGSIYYLTANSADDIFFREDVATFDGVVDDTVFEYYIDIDTLTLVKEASASNGDIYRRVLSVNNNKLTLNNYNSGGGNLLFSTNSKFRISNTTKNKSILPKLDLSWISYNESKNSINASKSLFNQKSNYLATTQYTYATGNDINVSLLSLKNSLTDTNTVQRGDYMTRYNQSGIPNVDFKTYKTLDTGGFEETGNKNISITYNFYNKNYEFIPDEYNAFVTPTNLYPYKQLNINDSLFYKNGSLYGDSPHTSDRVYKNNIDNSELPKIGNYLCTWLSGSNGNEIWLDRYYIPERVTTSHALSSSSSTIFNYKTLGQVLKDDNDIDSNYFDVESMLTFYPGQEYIYQRIGPKYVSRYLEHLNNNKILDRFQLKTSGGGALRSPDENNFNDFTYNLTNSYFLTSFNTQSNIDSQLTLSFWLKKRDWKEKSGHQLLGSYTNQGISVSNDNAVTPFVYIQTPDGRSIDVYNTVGRRLFTINPFPQETLESIIDIVRVDHLEDFYIITDARNLYKIQSNGATYDSKKITEITEYINYVIDGNILYVLKNTQGNYVKIDLVTEEVTTDLKVTIPVEDGIVYDIRSIAVDSDGNVAGFRGSKTIKYDNKYAISLIENVALVKESFDHVERTIIAEIDIIDKTQQPPNLIKDFMIYDSSIYYLIGDTLLYKVNEENVIFFIENIDPTPSAQDAFPTVAIDFVREYVDGKIQEFPIVISEGDGDNPGFITKIIENEGELNTLITSPISTAVFFIDKCNTPIRYNLTSYKYLKELKQDFNSLKFNFKFKNLNNNRDFLQARFEYDVSEFIDGSKHHFAIRVDTINGYINVFIDSNKVFAYNFNAAKYNLSNLLNDGFCIGSTNFYNNILLPEVLKLPNYYYCNDLFMEQPKFYKEAVKDIDIKFLYLNNININKLSVSLPAGNNNKTETIKTYFKWRNSISKSNDINIIIKGEKIGNNNELVEKIKQLIIDDVITTLPASTNIKNITIR